MSCPCRGKGLIRINYEDGSVFDLGVCTCEKGQWIRRRGVSSFELYATLYQITPDRVGPIEDFAEPDEIRALGLTPAVVLEDFTQAGQVGKKARL